MTVHPVPPAGALDPAAVEAALGTVCDPCSAAAGAPLSLREMGLVRECAVEDGTVRVSLAVTGPGCTFTGLLVDATRAA
ncbi:MAG TPA: iron-sulfur cluster assembly protein, partial [Pseudonocardia sp.]|nr:iron-sulfur cluster assembly protein [Pseudonocardia sp.]